MLRTLLTVAAALARKTLGWAWRSRGPLLATNGWQRALSQSSVALMLAKFICAACELDRDTEYVLSIVVSWACVVIPARLVLSAAVSAAGRTYTFKHGWSLNATPGGLFHMKLTGVVDPLIATTDRKSV